MKKQIILPLIATTLLTAGAIDTTLTRGPLSFHLQCDNNASLNRLTITPKGLSADNRPITEEIDGTITHSALADLNRDGSPELYVFVTGTGSGSYGEIVAYSADRNRSLSLITLTELPEDLAAGYMGHDTFALTENHLVRTFPIYKKGDPNCCPSGGKQVIRYRLEPGENTWKLTIDKSTGEKP